MMDRDTQRRLEQRRKAQRHAKRTWRDNPERAQLLYGIGASRQFGQADLFSERTPTPVRNSRNSDTEER
jgi:hypothetical protein